MGKLIKENDIEETMQEQRKKMQILQKVREKMACPYLQLLEECRSYCNRRYTANCSTKTSVKCLKCNVYLYLTAEHNCYLKFHEQPN